MARILESPHPIECEFRYYLVHDRAHPSGRDIFNEVEEERIYGIVKIPTTDAFMGEIKFYNDTTGLIDLLIREYSQAEWETMQAFELFPILHVFAVVKEVHMMEDTLEHYTITISKVRFNDH